MTAHQTAFDNAIDRACKAAIRAYRAGDSRTYATALIRIAADKVEVGF